MPGAALTACDDPVNVREVQFRQRPNQWLAREESHFRGSLAQAVDAVQHPLVLDARPEPDVLRRPLAAVPRRDVRGQALRSFRQELVDVPVDRLHGREYPIDESVRDSLFEQVRHAVDEDHLWLFHVDRIIQASVEQLHFRIGEVDF